ncbi:MAG TPA: FAD-linked oxidase C-terminal domain-containing protein [Nitrospira sp.]|nr:FAD-linked oxidase C-terminal domain-containing protein [Nitrospira sp.]
MQLTQIERLQDIAQRAHHGADRIRRRPDVDAAGLAADLRKAVEGEVRFDAGSRALYATDASNYRQVPIGVVIPRHIDDVVAALSLARRYGAPILARGGGTSMAGQSCNIALVLDCSKYMHRLLALDPRRKRARVQPGLVLDNLQSAAKRHRLTFPPDPATHDHCTLGGMIGNNSCGTHSVMGGTTADNVEALDILTYDGLRMQVGKTAPDVLNRLTSEPGRRGDIFRGLRTLRDAYQHEIRARFPKIPRRISGYNLPALLDEEGFDVAKALVGSECTCVFVLEATVRLVDSPPFRTLAVLGYPDVYRSGDQIMEILEHRPLGLEGLDRVLVEDLKRMKGPVKGPGLLPEGGGWLLVEFGGETQDEADAQGRRFLKALSKRGDWPSTRLFSDPQEQEAVWAVRKFGFATANVPGRRIGWTGWEDAAVPPDRVGAYLRDFRRLLDTYGYETTLFGHFGQGCIHTRIDYDLATRDGIAAFRSFHEEACDLVLSYGGSLSGEHGDGQSVAEFLPKMFGAELVRAFEQFKTIWDPDWLMNPGKIVRPYRVDENLRLGAGYNPPQVETQFRYPHDQYNFARASLRCIGIGECRREERSTMCPSYRVTREEMHSTRGRARLLFEMLEGDPVRDGWRDEHVNEALDLCLACKGCKGDCPVGVDMATYKAEFLSHYYSGRLRPVSAYSMGLIHLWARLASSAPHVANFLTQTPGIRRLVKRLGGISPHRSLPPFAAPTFTEWFANRGPSKAGRIRVLLWPDTFNNYFYPRTARAAVEVLEAFGCHVIVPPRPLCCGRPLYDFGMLSQAKGQLREILSALEPEIEAGTPIVGLEPSCVAVFRDELTNLFPHDLNAERLGRQTMTLAEFIEHKLHGVHLPVLPAAAIVHGHCHQKALMGVEAERQVLGKLGLDFTILDSGCCGMAGSFGFKREHYETSLKVGNLALLPAVRQAPKETFVVADGFSCREQIRQTTDRRGVHLAEVLHLAIQKAAERGQGIAGRNGSLTPYPERSYFKRNRVVTLDRPAPYRPSRGIALLAGAAAVAIGAAAIGSMRRRSP